MAKESKSIQLRNKIVGLMYLIFFALAFLSVPDEFLDYFKYMNDNLEQSATEIEQSSQRSYAQYKNTIENADVDPATRLDIEQVSKMSAAVCEQLEQQKKDFLQITGGYLPNGYPNRSKNADLANAEIIKTGKATEVKDALTNYRDQLLEMTDPTLHDYIKKTINVNDDIMVSNDNKVSWEKFYFYKKPVSVVITTYSSFENDVRMVENVVVNHYLDEAIQAKKLELSENVADQDKALLLLPYQDTPYYIGDEVMFYVDYPMTTDGTAGEIKLQKLNGNTYQDQTILSADEKGFVRYTANRLGKYRVTLTVNEENVTSDYSVIKHTPYINNTYDDPLWAGVDNMLEIVHEGYRPSEISVETNKGSVIRKGSDFYFRSNELGAVHLKIYGKKNGKRMLLTSKDFDVQPLGNPVASLDGNSGGDILRNNFTKSEKLTIKIDGAPEKDVLFVKEFRVTKINGDNNLAKSQINKGVSFNNKVNQLVSKANIGDVYLFDAFVVKDLNGELKEVSPIVFTVK